MTNTDLKPNLEKLLALRAELLGDMTKMEDDSLKDHAKTISIPTDKEELGSDNAEQELTLTLLGSGEDILDQVEAAIHRIEDGGYGWCEKCGEANPQVPPGRHPLCRRLRAMCVGTGRSADRD